MKKRSRQIPLNNEKGNMLIIVVVIIMVLTSLGLYGLSSTSIEIAASGSERRDKENFANAESGLKFAIANFDLIYNNNNNAGGTLYGGTQLTTDDQIMTFSMGGGGVINSTCAFSGPTPLRDMTPPTMLLSAGNVVFNFALNNIAIARVEIKAIMLNPVNIASLTAMANNVPREQHLSPAPFGFDRDEYKSRNYCITSTALDTQGNLTSTIIQSGVVVAAQKKSVDFLIGL